MHFHVTAKNSLRIFLNIKKDRTTIPCEFHKTKIISNEGKTSQYIQNRCQNPILSLIKLLFIRFPKQPSQNVSSLHGTRYDASKLNITQESSSSFSLKH